MNYPVKTTIINRRSVRTYKEEPLLTEDLHSIENYLKTIENPFGIPRVEEAYGYAFEKFVLYAASIGVGTVWIAGTMDHSVSTHIFIQNKDPLYQQVPIAFLSYMF